MHDHCMLMDKYWHRTNDKALLTKEKMSDVFKRLFRYTAPLENHTIQPEHD